ncbi:IS3 family transposase [Duganella sp. FT80W]|uniref:IS3 family transposase n=1 Tax=Duganella guangzhouensis TaxID=2666084 RepID=A0A6I2L7S0_9BURK|nr:IS3 family transposase [Duganella guangzhouensis]
MASHRQSYLTGAWRAAPLRQGQPVSQQGVSSQADRIRHDVFDESQGKLLGYSPTESWFNSFKNERYHGVRYATQAEMKATSFEYIEVFNNRKRQYSTLGYKLFVCSQN